MLFGDFSVKIVGKMKLAKEENLQGTGCSLVVRRGLMRGIQPGASPSIISAFV